MQCIRQIAEDIYWVGGHDRRIERFENIFPVPNGISYNSYVILDEKTVLMDTIDSSLSEQLLENVTAVLNGKTLDYIVLSHIEPDHCAAIVQLCRLYSDLKLVGNAKTFQFLEQFYPDDLSSHYLLVKESDILCLGRHTLRFYLAPMVHWPEVMFSYEENSRILFSADAFGSFRALSGNLFADEVDYNTVFMDEARRYYANIVGKYGSQVQAIIKKVSDNDISMICSLHGPIWRENIDFILKKYDLWSRYVPEKSGIVIAFGSMYGNTENAVQVLANMLAERGIEDIRMYDVSKTHLSYIIGEAFQFSHLVFAAPTYNMNLYMPMETLLHDMSLLNMQNRKAAVIGNGTWAPRSATIMQKHLATMKNIELVGEPLILNSALKQEQLGDLSNLADALALSLKQAD